MAAGERPTRIERDTLGEVGVPADALYGAQTARAVDNFAISGWRMPERFITALARIKAAYARANGEAGLLPPDVAAAIAAAADVVAAGAYREHFPVDVFQTGSGTSSNMNANEVVARLATAALGAGHAPVHPNDDVNRGQSSNDVVPAALRLAAASAWRDETRPALVAVAAALERLAREHVGTVALGRTHLMDAVPTSYGRTFAAWAARVGQAIGRADDAAAALRRLPLGGTAVGSGIGASAQVVGRVVAELRRATGLELDAEAIPAVGIAAQDAPIAFADALAGVGRALAAVANDLRLRASGPFGGLGELKLPAVQPGSSIMPGKVNPVIPEAVVQATIQIEGLAAACRASAALHQLELSHANPLLAWNLDAMARLLAGAGRALVERCLDGLAVDVERAAALAAGSPALATALAGRIGYERAAEIARLAVASGETVAEVARRLAVLPDAELDDLLDCARLAGVPG
jgi:fumarate hydratase class II